MTAKLGTVGMVASIATLFGGSLLGGLPSVDAASFSKLPRTPEEREREQRHSADRLARAQAKRERKAKRRSI